MEQAVLTEDKWFDEYKPIYNHLDSNASWNDGEQGCMFETYGKEQEYVYSTHYKFVWTYMDVDGGTAIVAGRHFVNRIGYFVTEKPWETGDEYIQISEDDEMEEDE